MSVAINYPFCATEEKQGDTFSYLVTPKSVFSIMESAEKTAHARIDDPKLVNELTQKMLRGELEAIEMKEYRLKELTVEAYLEGRDQKDLRQKRRANSSTLPDK